MNKKMKSSNNSQTIRQVSNLWVFQDSKVVLIALGFIFLSMIVFYFMDKQTDYLSNLSDKILELI